MNDNAQWRITEIVIYPIKSTAGISVDSCDVGARGLEMDRRWMVIDAHGDCLTGREFPQLTQVHTRIEDDTLRVTAPGAGELLVRIPHAANRTRTVRIWNDECLAVGADACVDAWFTRVLGTPCHLVYMHDRSERPIEPGYGRTGDLVSFADGYPLLLVSRASLDDLNARLAEPVSMRRFRPNLVVDGSLPYEEDEWRHIRAGSVRFDGIKNCSRCVFTTIDPESGERHPHQEPLRTLASYRRRADGDVRFGQNLIPRSLGRLRVGDRVSVETASAIEQAATS